MAAMSIRRIKGRSRRAPPRRTAPTAPNTATRLPKTGAVREIESPPLTCCHRISPYQTAVTNDTGTVTSSRTLQLARLAATATSTMATTSGASGRKRTIAPSDIPAGKAQPVWSRDTASQPPMIATSRNTAIWMWVLM